MLILTPSRACSAASPLKAASQTLERRRDARRRRGRGSQGVISQSVPSNSWSERPVLSRIGTGVKPVSAVRKSQ